MKRWMTLTGVVLLVVAVAACGVRRDLRLPDERDERPVVRETLG